MMGKRLDRDKFEESVRAWNPEYFDKKYQDACARAYPMPTSQDLNKGDEVDLVSYGAPGNVRTFTYLEPYGKKAKDLLALYGTEHSLDRARMDKLTARVQKRTGIM